MQGFQMYFKGLSDQESAKELQAFAFKTALKMIEAYVSRTAAYEDAIETELKQLTRYADLIGAAAKLAPKNLDDVDAALQLIMARVSNATQPHALENELKNLPRYVELIQAARQAK